jgi:hypothetical protein
MFSMQMKDSGYTESFFIQRVQILRKNGYESADATYRWKCKY